MTGNRIRIDPEREEIDLLLRCATRLGGGRVLEVGCGDGRLTRLYSEHAGQVLAIDPNPLRIAAARARHADTPADVEYRHASILDLETGPNRFDLAILSWSL